MKERQHTGDCHRLRARWLGLGDAARNGPAKHLSALRLRPGPHAAECVVRLVERGARLRHRRRQRSVEPLCALRLRREVRADPTESRRRVGLPALVDLRFGLLIAGRQGGGVAAIQSGAWERKALSVSSRISLIVKGAGETRG